MKALKANKIKTKKQQLNSYLELEWRKTYVENLHIVLSCQNEKAFIFNLFACFDLPLHMFVYKSFQFLLVFGRKDCCQDVNAMALDL